METGILSNSPQVDTSLSTKTSTDTSTYYNFEKGQFLSNTGEDKVLIFDRVMSLRNTAKINSTNSAPRPAEKTNQKDNYYFDDFFYKIINPPPDSPKIRKDVNVGKKISVVHAKKSGTVRDAFKEVRPESKQVAEKSPDFYKASKDWIIILLLLLLFVISWIRLSYFKSMQHILRSCYNFQLSQKFFRERNTVSIRVSLILNMIFILTHSLFMFFSLDYFNLHIMGFTGILFYLICCGTLTGLNLLKFFIYRWLGLLLQKRRYFSEYLYNYFIYQKVSGVLIIPFLIGIPFMPPLFLATLIRIGLLVIFICLIFRIFRGIFLSFRFNVAIFYIFLYLCALEIIPLLIFLKLIFLFG